MMAVLAVLGKDLQLLLFDQFCLRTDCAEGFFQIRLTYKQVHEEQ